MLEIKKVNKKDENYKKIKELMKKLFPKNELFPLWLLNLVSRKKNCNYLSYYDKSNLIGISYSYKYQDLVFILYLAVSKEFNSKGYGSMILDLIKENNNGCNFVLNVEPLDENSSNFKERERRYRFYFKNGFKKTNLIFKDELPYEVLSTSVDLDAKKYKKLLRKMILCFYVLSLKNNNLID